ncbi:MAG: hypothetical protein HY226_04220 [Candidatus Vogelbacteria bacterium]|nr:hypothetical protein [Candidatus Vogelbacteria bacterium]
MKENKKFEQHTINSLKQTSAEGILYDYEKGGRIDFSELPKDKLTEIKDEYVKSFEKLKLESQTEIFEQLMLAGTVTKDEAVKIVNLIGANDVHGSDELVKLAQYMAKVLEPAKYLEAFYMCMERFPYYAYEQKQEVVDELKSRDDHRSVLMLLRYKNLTDIAPKKNMGIDTNGMPAHEAVKIHKEEVERWKEKQKHRTTEQHSILSRYFNHVDNAEELMSAESLIDPNRAKTFIDKATDPHGYLFLSRKFFGRETDTARMDEILKIGASDYEYPDINNFKNDPDSVRLRNEYFEIYDRMLTREAKHALNNFSEYTEGLTSAKKIGLLCQMNESSIPIFTHIDETGLNKSEIKQLLSKIEEEGYIFNLSGPEEIEKLVTLGFEKQAVKAIITDLDGGNQIILNRVIRNMPKLFTILSEGSKRAIINSINQKMPAAWFSNLDYAIENGFISINQLDKLITGDKERLVSYYPQLIYAFRKFISDDKEFEKRQAKINYLAKKAITEDVSKFIYSTDILLRVFSEDELGTIIQSNLQSHEVGVGLALSILAKASNENQQKAGLVKKYRELAANTLLSKLQEDPEAIFNNPEISYRLHHLIDVLPAKEIINAFIKCADKIKEKDIFENHEFTKLILSKIKAQDALLSYLDTPNGKFSALSCANTVYALTKENPGIDTNDFFTKLREKTKDLMNQNEFLVFKIASEIYFSDNVNILIHDIRQKAATEAHEYTKKFPNRVEVVLKVLNKCWGNGDKEYNDFIVNNIDKLIFLNTKNKYDPGGDVFSYSYLKPEIQELIRNNNPIINLEQEIDSSTTVESFYSSAIGVMRKYPIYQIYERKINEIIKDEIERGGTEILKLEHINSDLRAIFKDILALSQCTWFSENINVIGEMSQTQKKELIKTAMLSLKYGIADKTQFEISDKNILQINNKIRERLINTLLNIAGVNINSINESVNQPSPKLLEAMAIYYGDSCEEDMEMSTAMKQLIEKLIAGTYTKTRWWGESGVEGEDALNELKRDNVIPAQMSLKQYKQWIGTSKSTLTEQLNISLENLHQAIEKSLSQALFDNHIDGIIHKEYGDILTEYKSIIEKLENIEDADEKKQFIKDNEEKINQLRALLYLGKLSKMSNHELQNKSINVEGKNIGLDQVWRTLERGILKQYPEFKTDIDKLKTLVKEARDQIFEGSKISKSELSITDDLDLERYFYIGEEPVPSCQNFNSNGGLNFGLLAYVQDPNTKILQILNEEGVIIARSIMRLLEDGNGNPCVFLERIYSVNLNPKIEEAVINFAKQKVSDIGIKLYSESITDPNDELEEVEYQTLYCRGSRVPYVYTDSGGGKKRNGIYEARGMRVA